MDPSYSARALVHTRAQLESGTLHLDDLNSAAYGVGASMAMQSDADRRLGISSAGSLTTLEDSVPLGRNAAVLLQIFRQIDSLIAAGNFDVDTNVRTAAAGFGQVTDNGKLVTKMFDLTSGVELKEAMVNLSGSLGPKDLGTIWSTRWVQAPLPLSPGHMRRC